MNNPIYIAFDDADSLLGHFFQGCADYIKQNVVQEGMSYESINSESLTKDTINKYTCNAEEYVFCSFSCHTAKGIGQEFQDAYVLWYLGYKEEAWVVPSYEDIFINCATSGLISYIKGKTIKQSYEDMIAEYDKHIKTGKVNPIYAALLKNKMALVSIINNDDKTILD